MHRLSILVFLAVTTAAMARVIPDEVPDLPVLSEQVRRGGGHVVALTNNPGPAKTVDGSITDWKGTGTGYGGTIIHSRGELVYQDHVFDSYGADDGGDAERAELLGPVIDAEPRAYRPDHPTQYAVDEFGGPAFGPITGRQSYGDVDGANFVDVADILEVRVAADDSTVWLLVRTTTMRVDEPTAVLLLADTDGTAPAVQSPLPFGANLSTTRADVAMLLAGSTGRQFDVATGVETAFPGTVATDPSSYTNAIEAAIPRHLLEASDGRLRLAVATGRLDGSTGDLAPLADVDANVANVAFRTTEPVRSFFEQEQALALGAGTIDPFFREIDPTALSAGATERYVPGTGYHDRIFVSTELISTEGSDDGIFQHYGVFLPSNYVAGTPAPLQMWLHFRGGKAHTAAAVVPRIMEDYGEEVGTIVVSPRGRGTSTWYVGEGHVDFLEVWDDVHERFSIDPDRVYVSGHSMGGWGTYLMSVLYPDRFAAGMPVAGPSTQGLAVGCDFEGCNSGSNGGRGDDQYTRRMLPNLRHVPLAIFHGLIDELVPVSGVTRQALALAELGYPYRYYLFPTYEHYSHPIVDEWEEGVRYMHRFTRDPNPRCVTYIRDMPFEQATEQVRSGGAELDFDFDSAYWMSGLVAEEVPGTLEDGTPGDLGVVRFDGCSFGIEETPTLLVPAAGGPSSPGQAGPYVMTGLDPVPDPLTAAETAYPGFEIELSGATAVTLDLVRMSIDTSGSVFGTIVHDTASGPLALTLDGGWSDGTNLYVSLDGAPGTTLNPADGRITVSIPVGTTDLLVEEF